MPSFAIFEQSSPGHSQPAKTWPLRHAHMFGADDVPIPGEVKFDAEAGVIRCSKRTPDSSGLSLQFPIDAIPGRAGAGLLTLQTCLLPERDKPYLLSLELARHRIMLILNKLEDWALFDLPASDEGMQLFEKARQAFTDAVVAQGDTAGVPAGGFYSTKADELARLSLAYAMEAGELLTLSHAKTQFGKRMSGELAQAAARVAAPTNALTDHEVAESRNALLGSVGVILPTPPQIGCVVSSEQFTPALQKAVQLGCDFISMPMRWVEMEPTEGRYVFSKTDRWIEWAIRTARVPIVGGPVVDLRRGSVPEWLYIWEHDYQTLRELVYEHVKNLVTRYRRTVGTWTVVSGLHVSSNFTLSLEQVMDLTRLAVMVVRKLQPSAKVQVQIDQPWGEYFAFSNTRAMPPIMYAEMVGQAGINPDLFSLRVEMGQAEPGRSTRDLMALSAMLDRFAALERPLSVTLSAPSQPPSAEDLGLEGEHEPGHYRSAWSAEAQTRWMTQAIAVVASKPYVHSVAWHELYDLPKAHDARHDGLFDANLAMKPSLARLAEIRGAIRQKQSPITLPEKPGAISL
jgi:hypothetical protein